MPGKNIDNTLLPVLLWLTPQDCENLKKTLSQYSDDAAQLATAVKILNVLNNLTLTD